MRNYEAIFIFRPEEEHVTQGNTAVKNEFQNAGITILQQDDMGQKDLAYDIKRNSKGHYFCYKIQSEAGSLKTIEKNLKLKQEILKFIFFRDEKQ
ncbi:MAG: 30S ribosomal protein S6 [Spirochaetales bacterium]|nr:30S ribosomal protein S6 [Spirochaetales bacterium]